MPAELVEPLLMPTAGPSAEPSYFMGIDWGREESMTCVVEILYGKIKTCTHVTKSWRQ